MDRGGNIVLTLTQIKLRWSRITTNYPLYLSIIKAPAIPP